MVGVTVKACPARADVIIGRLIALGFRLLVMDVILFYVSIKVADT